MKSEPERPTVESLRIDEVKRRRYLEKKMEDHKTIPEILIASAEAGARGCRKEIQGLKDRLRRNPLLPCTANLLEHEFERLGMYEQDINDMREFYGKQNLLS